MIEDAIETVIWGLDCPHPDGDWPEATKYIGKIQPLASIDQRNAGKFY
jgi:hypothetical protein